MQAAQCNWRIVKDWKNSLFSFFTLCYFSDRDAFNSLIPFLGKNISFPVIGQHGSWDAEFHYTEPSLGGVIDLETPPYPFFCCLLTN